MDCWLPVQSHADEDNKIITLNQLSANSIQSIQAPRADLKGAIYQFLIGLLQTTFAPKNKRAWKKYWKKPPSAAELNAAFAPYESVFALNTANGTASFMQDFNLADGNRNQINALFIDTPGGNALKNNTDHFIKRGHIEQLSPYWAAMALFTLQINAPSGGVGHRVSLRGGGSLTTLVLPPEEGTHNTLWHRLWLNILTEDELFDLHGNHALDGKAAIFPWMAATLTSEKKGMEVTPQHAHPLQAYWSMPRRIRLDWQTLSTGQCDLTGEPSDQLLNHFQMKNYGVNYAGSWVHPLTPYAFQQGKEPLSIKAQPSGLGYRHWLGLAVTDSQGKVTKEPARVVNAYIDERKYWIDDEGNTNFSPRLWAFGYDMDNMKARCWYETTMPIFNLDVEEQDDIAEYAQKMIYAATDVLKILKGALKNAWFTKPKKNPRAKKARFEFIEHNFWACTENTFYKHLKEHVAAIQTEDLKQSDALLKTWGYHLKETAFALFDQYALANLNEDGDYQRVIKARHGKGSLEHFLNGNKKLKQLSV